MTAPFLRHWNVILLTGVLSLSRIASGAAPVDLAFQSANRLFEQGKFGEAAAEYQLIAENGKLSPELMFNLGTAHLKDDQMGKAIAALLAAQKLAPRDEAVEQNLQFSRLKAGTAEMSLSWWRRMFRLLTLNEWTLLAAVPVWCLLGLAVILQVAPTRQNMLRRWLVLSGWLAGIGVTVLLIAAWDRLGSRMGVIAGKQAVARFGPVGESQEAFALSDGTETVIVDETEGWFNVRDGSGRQGWVKSDQVALPPGG